MGGQGGPQRETRDPHLGLGGTYVHTCTWTNVPLFNGAAAQKEQRSGRGRIEGGGKREREKGGERKSLLKRIGESKEREKEETERNGVREKGRKDEGERKRKS